MNIEKEFLYLVWQCTSNGREYIVGELSKNKQYEFCYCEEIEEAMRNGFKPLISFSKTDVVYRSEELFPAFSSRLPDRKRKDIDKILNQYGLNEYDAYELLKRSGAKLPTDNLQFVCCRVIWRSENGNLAKNAMNLCADFLRTECVLTEKMSISVR